MKDFQYNNPQMFEAFVKSAQYFVRLKTQQDIWDHLGKFITTYFPARWAAFAGRDSAKEIAIHHFVLQDEADMRPVLTDEVRTLIADVLDSGFLASQAIPTPAASMTVFLPIVEKYRTERVMLISHKTGDPLPNELLNIYLAIAGLAGTTIERLDNERELTVHRTHLEELVKERTAELEEAKRHNELILHSVGEGICGIDPDGKITFVNPRAAQLIGWDPNDLIGRNAHATFHHTRPDGCPYPVEACPVHSALKNGNGEYEANGEFLRKDGTRFPVEFMTTPLTEGGSIIGAVMVFSDITERKRAEEDLRKLTEDLKRSNSDLQQFAYIASHDLQSPLRNIEGFVKMLARRYKGQLDGKADEYIRYISEGVKDMQTLIHDLLEFSKVDRGGKVFTKVDTSSCIAKALSNQSHAIIERNAEINLDEPFPAVFGDSAQLTSLFQNLIGNAIKFCRERPVIYISVTKEDKEYVFLVKDNGIGINPENSDKIFAIFHRLHSKSEYPGTGIGLAICSKIIERHKGRIWVESEPGKGSAFKFTFPIPE